MSRIQSLLLLLTALTVCCTAVPTDSKTKKRSVDKHLSDIDHEEDGEHNPDYDHDAFLGHEDKQTFDQLSPEESKERLSLLVKKIDKDGDGFVSESELEEWIKYVQKRYIINDTDRMWKDHKPEEDNTLTWPNYQKRTFGYEDDPNEKGSRTEAYADMINRDKRRWDKADKNQDGRLSKEEFMDFLHPEDAEHMRDIVVMETIEDIDKDKDGQIDENEYIADIWGDDEDDDEDDDDEDDDDHEGGEKVPGERKKRGAEPEWVGSEREQFHQFRDKDHDGKLNHEEIKQWIIPEDYDHSSSEAKHLISSCDTEADDGEKDGKLSLQEILDKYDLFVGSQATDFGEALTRHDEF